MGGQRNPLRSHRPLSTNEIIDNKFTDYLACKEEAEDLDHPLDDFDATLVVTALTGKDMFFSMGKTA